MPRTAKPIETLGYDSLPFRLPPTRERIAFDANAVATKVPDMGRVSNSGATPVSQRFGRATPGPSAFIRDSRVARDSDAPVDCDAVLRDLISRLPEDERAHFAELLLGDARALEGRVEAPAMDSAFPNMNRLG